MTAMSGHNVDCNERTIFFSSLGHIVWLFCAWLQWADTKRLRIRLYRCIVSRLPPSECLQFNRHGCKCSLWSKTWIRVFHKVVLSIGYNIPDDILEDMVAVAHGTNGEVSQHTIQPCLPLTLPDSRRIITQIEPHPPRFLCASHFPWWLTDGLKCWRVFKFELELNMAWSLLDHLFDILF